MIEIAIFVLFHPQRLTVKAVPGTLLRVNEMTIAGGKAVGLRKVGSEIDWFAERETRTARVVKFQGDMFVSVPGRIERRYRGALTVTPEVGELRAVLTLDVEDAVGAITEAESPPGARMEAKKAQAVLARSWLLGNRGRHRGYDFCDTTHCQVFKNPVRSEAAMATRGVVLTYEGKVFAPAYSASCGGRTKTAVEVGWGAEPYPYFAVDCSVCQRDEKEWERALPELPGKVGDEGARIALGRKFGWDILPSNNYVLTGKVARGKGRGHGVGYCQRGGAGLGEGFDQLLRRYLPNTVVGVGR